jgi:hypothetical protein
LPSPRGTRDDAAVQKPFCRACDLQLFKSPFKKYLADIPKLPSLASRKRFEVSPEVLTHSNADLCFPFTHGMS